MIREEETILVNSSASKSKRCNCFQTLENGESEESQIDLVLARADGSGLPLLEKIINDIFQPTLVPNQNVFVDIDRSIAFVFFFC